MPKKIKIVFNKNLTFQNLWKHIKEPEYTKLTKVKL